MQLGMIGLGRMGGNLVRRAHGGRARMRRVRPQHGRGRRAGRGGRGRARRRRADLVAKLTAPRAVWLMVPGRA